MADNDSDLVIGGSASQTQPSDSSGLTIGGSVGPSDNTAPPHVNQRSTFMGEGAGFTPKGIVAAAGDVGRGVREGLFSTVSGATDLFNKLSDSGLVGPASGAHIPTDKLNELAGEGQQKNLPEQVGYAGETLMEFLLGDEALKGLSFADKLGQAAKTAKILESSPKLMKAAQVGARVLDQSARAAATQTAQTTARTGGDVKEGLKEGATVGAIAAPLSAVGEGLSSLGGKLGEGAEAANNITESAKNATTDTQGTALEAKDAIEKSEQELHQNYENGINNLVNRASGTEVDPVHDAALNGKPAMATRAKDLLQQPIPSDSFLVNKAKSAIGEKLDAPVKDILRTIETGYKDPKAYDAWAEQLDAIKNGDLADINGKLYNANDYNNYIKNVQTGAKAEEPSEVARLKEPEKIDPYNMDNLIKLRQTLRQLASQYDYGNINSRTILSKGGMLHAIDDTIDQLAQKVPDKNILSDYRALREDYKSKINIYDDPIVKNIRDGKYGDAGKALLSGNRAAPRIDEIRNAIGDARMEELSKNMFGNMLQTATDTNGQVNSAKLIRAWEKIPQETREALFHPKVSVGPQNEINSLMKDAKVARNVQYLTRTGVLSPAIAVGGQLTHMGLLGMLLSEGGAGAISMSKVGDMLDFIANHPWTWKIVGKTGKALEATGSKIAPIGSSVTNQTISPDTEQLKRNVYNSASGLR